VIVGDGPEMSNLQSLTTKLGINHKVKFAGALWGQDLIDLYAGARAVYYAPYDEDYGLVVPEAFRSQKPVITTDDSGGVLEFVVDGETGLVTLPSSEDIANSINRLSSDLRCKRLDMQVCERLIY
jgi:glycosyltransferase involved in cell wall biosynthesis